MDMFPNTHSNIFMLNIYKHNIVFRNIPIIKLVLLLLVATKKKIISRTGRTISIVL